VDFIGDAAGAGFSVEGQMATMRTVLVGLSPMLRDIVHECVLRHFNTEIVGELSSDDLATVRGMMPDLVIVSLLTDESDDIGIRLLEIVPKAKILVLSPDKRKAVVSKMRIHSLAISDFSAEELVAAIRSFD
jgi:DNA-binding NarL/FixJ family response regulator